MFCFGLFLLVFDVSVQHAGVLVSLLLLDEAWMEILCRVPLCSLAIEAPLTREQGKTEVLPGRRGSEAFRWGRSAAEFEGAV